MKEIGFIFDEIMAKRILTGLKPTGQQLHLGNYF
jgi:hypothetical protein